MPWSTLYLQQLEQQKLYSINDIPPTDTQRALYEKHVLKLQPKPPAFKKKNLIKCDLDWIGPKPWTYNQIFPHLLLTWTTFNLVAYDNICFKKGFIISLLTHFGFVDWFSWFKLPPSSIHFSALCYDAVVFTPGFLCPLTCLPLVTPTGSCKIYAHKQNYQGVWRTQGSMGNKYSGIYTHIKII